MTLTQMRYFLEVCRQGGVTRAAAALHISQPSVSSAIRELEGEFGVALFHRAGRRFTLTREGEYFRARCEGVLEESDALLRQMRDFGQKHKRIHIGVPPMIGTFLFPSIFEAFHGANPDVRLELTEHGSMLVRELVRQDKLDIAIAVADMGKESDLEAVPLLSTTLQFCVAPSHPLAGRETLSLAELDRLPIILFKDDSQQNQLLLNRFAALDIQPNVLLRSSQLYTIKRMILSGEAGAFLFREVAEADRELVGIPLAEPIAMDICLIWKRGRQVYSDTIKFIRFVREHPAGRRDQP